MTWVLFPETDEDGERQEWILLDERGVEVQRWRGGDLNFREALESGLALLDPFVLGAPVAYPNNISSLVKDYPEGSWLLREREG